MTRDLCAVTMIEKLGSDESKGPGMAVCGRESWRVWERVVKCVRSRLRRPYPYLTL